MSTQIAVLLSHQLNPLTERATACSGDAKALALALSLVDSSNVQALTVADMPESAARDYLAQGIARLILLNVENNDLSSMSQRLATACRDMPMILMGQSAGESDSAQWGSGLLPYALAHALGRPMINDVIAVQKDGDAWLIEQSLDKGARRHLRVTVPVILSINPRIKVVERYSVKSKLTGSIIGLTDKRERVEDAHLYPKAVALKPLEAKTQQSGHARMLSAVGGVPSTAGQIIKDGTAQEQAVVVLEYLQQHGLWLE